MRSAILFSVLLCSAPHLLAAPAHSTGSEGVSGAPKTDVPVQQLEKLKTTSDAVKEIPTVPKEHLEYHRLDAVKSNGDVVSHFEQHTTADVEPGKQPQLHSHAVLDVPAQGIHREVVQEGQHVSAVETTAPPGGIDETTPKIFHGAARLVQTGSGSSAPLNPHTAVRRAFNADIRKETNHNMDHYSSYSGVQYTPLDMAEYVFWTGDEKGVTAAIEEFLQEGMMTKEEAILFLQEIKFNMEYLRAHYAQNAKMEEIAQQEKLRSMLMEQANNRDGYQYRPANIQSFPLGSNADILRTISNKNWERNNLNPAFSIMPSPTEFREPVKRSTAYVDPMLQTNIVGTQDYDKDGLTITEEEYEEIMDKLKMADSLYTEYTLEEIIYQLAKMMFSQSLTRDPHEARASIQRFMAFLELEAERGQLSRTIEKKVLDVMVAALSDSVADHPELLQPREGLGSMNSGNRLLRQFLDSSVAEPSMSRAILAAYKDELMRGSPHKLAFGERN